MVLNILLKNHTMAQDTLQREILIDQRVNSKKNPRGLHIYFGFLPEV